MNRWCRLLIPALVLLLTGLGTSAAPPTQTKTPLVPADIVYEGFYDIYLNSTDTTYMSALTHRYVSGQLRLLTLTHTGTLIEFTLSPTLGGYSNAQQITARWDLSAATWDHTGLYWDEPTQRLWVTASIDYGSSGTYYPTRIQTLSLGANGAVSTRKEVSLEGINAKRLYGGVTRVPDPIAASIGCTGKPYLAGFGGYASLFAQTSWAPIGPSLLCLPDLAGYTNGAEIPASAFTVLLSTSTSNRGLRKTLPTNEFDGSSWLSPNGQGLGWMVWGDSYYNTGMWIETATKQGFAAIASLCKGRCWYQNSTLHFDDRQFELHLWDVSTLDDGLLTRPTSMTEIFPPRGKNPLPWDGNGSPGNISGATYDAVTGKLYLVGYPLGDGVSGSRVYQYAVGTGTGTPPPTPSPVNCVVSAFGSWSSWAPINATTEQRTRTRTVTTPASYGGTPCPALSEVETQPIVTTPPPPPPPVSVVTVTAIPSRCQLTVSANQSPDGTAGWAVRFRRNGLAHGGKDASPPYAQSAEVILGSYLITAEWTKGATTQRVTVGTYVCPTP